METSANDIVHALPDAAALLDAEDRVVQWNRHAAWLYGIPAEDAVGKPLRDLIDVPPRADDEPADPIPMRQTIADQRVANLQVAWTRLSDGRSLYLASVSVADALRTAADLDDLAYAVSHDLQAPLRALAGYIGILEEDAGPSLDADGQHALGRCKIAVKRMQSMVQNLVEYSRIGLRGSPFTDVNLKRAALNVWQSLPLSETATLDVQELPTVHVDERQIVALLGHLFDNIQLHAGAVGTVSLSGEVEQGRVRLCLADDGDGFEARHSERMLRPFQNLRAPGGEHQGMGLALARRIVHRHGGNMRLVTGPGEGLQVLFDLPVAR